MMTLKETVLEAAADLRMVCGKDAMIDEAMRMAAEIAEEFDLDNDYEIEQMIWNNM